MNLLPLVLYVVAAAGLVLGVVAFVRRDTPRDPLGPRPSGALPATGAAVLVALGAWLVADVVLGEVKPRVGLTQVEVGNAAFVVRAAIAVALLRVVRRGAPVPVLSPGRLVVIGLCGGVVAFGAATVITTLVELTWTLQQAPRIEQQVVQMGRTAQSYPWTGMVVTAAILAPFAEEVVWRGAVLPALAQWMPVGRAVFVQAAAFGAIHVIGMPAHAWPLAAAFAAVGWVAGRVYVRTGSLPAAFLVHALFNSINLVMLRFGVG